MSATDDWRERAACRGFPTALFFPAEHDDDQSDGDEWIAKQICASCPVKAPCQAEQVAEPYGVRGDMTAEERGYGRRGRLGKGAIKGLAAAVVEVFEDHPDAEFTADTMNDVILEMTGRRWPRNSINAALLRTYRQGLTTRRHDVPTDKLHYRLNQEHQ